jgi:pyruvate formate lyase activating enzyme
VSRFHPTYKLTDAGITPSETLRRARQIGIDAGLRYVYEGNIPGEGEDTLCWSCGKKLIRRIGFQVIENAAANGVCGHCGAVVDGVWT